MSHFPYPPADDDRDDRDDLDQICDCDLTEDDLAAEAFYGWDEHTTQRQRDEDMYGERI